MPVLKSRDSTREEFVVGEPPGNASIQHQQAYNLPAYSLLYTIVYDMGYNSFLQGK